MAAESTTDLVDYLGEYRRYFEEFVRKINPEDQLPMKVNAYNITQTELFGEIIYLTLQYIKQPRCPRNLQGYLVRLVLQEIKDLCEKQPEECGFKLEMKTYAPLKLMQAVTNKVNEIFTRYLDNSRLVTLPPPSSKLPPLARSGALKNGKRKMEDRHIEIYDLHTTCNVQNDSLASYFAVFDGHGGEDAAVYCATHLHQYLAESIYYPTDPERALCDAFHITDTRFIEKEKTQKVSGGTTAVCVLLLDKKLYIAWVGDSLAMLAKRGKVEELVYPHRLSRYDESERIQQMGGMLAFNQGTVRVNGVLAVSRAIGDVQYKPYVTSAPDTRCISLDGTEDFLIIATDGVWDFVNTYDAAMIVYLAIREYPDDPNYAVTRLIKAAKHAGSLDNITAIVVFLTAPSDIAARSTDVNSVFVVKSMKNMALNNPYVQKDLSDGMFFKQMKQYQQQQQPYDNDQEQRHANGSEETPMDDGGFHDEITCGGPDGKHEENDAADYIYEDLGPETDVDAIDDANNTDNVDNVIENPFLDNAIASNLPHNIFQGDKNIPKHENNFQEDNAVLKVTLETTLGDEDSSANNEIKTLQHALLPEADNVADSEDSEDEWNYYRVGPNKEKDTAASSEELREIKNVEHLDEDNNVEELPSRSPTSERNGSNNSSSSSSECESQKGEEILPELSNTDIGIEEKHIDSAFLKIEKQVEQKEEEEEEEKGEKEEKEEKEKEEEGKERNDKEIEYNQKEEKEDMDSQLNPNAAEFVPVSSPKRSIKLSTINDSFVSGSPMKIAIMDDIMIPSQQEFDEEISARPHEIDEKDSSPNGNHAVHSDYDFFTEQKIMNPIAAAAITTTVCLDESEISSTKAEYGDETLSFLTSADLHKTDMSAMEESSGDSDCDIYNRDNPMTISYTPCDFKAAFNKEVDLNAVHDLSDGDLEEENCSSEIQTPQSPKATDISRPMEFDILANGDSSNQMQKSYVFTKDGNSFVNFEDSVEPKNTEFIQVELELHPSSSPTIEPSFEYNFSKEEDKCFNLLENKEETTSIGRQEEQKEQKEHEEHEEQEKETEQVETYKEADYVEDEKDIVADNDIVVPSSDNSELIVDKPIEIPTDLTQSELLQDTMSQEEYNFLSSTIDESSKLNLPCAPSMETELLETSSEALKNGLISSMENLKLTTTKEEERPIMVFNLSTEVSELQSSQNAIDPFISGESILSDINSKRSILEDLITQQPDLTENHDKESSFLPTAVSETLSDNDRPTENLFKLEETTTKVPIIDDIEETKANEHPQSCPFEDINERKSTDKMEIDEENEFEKINDTVASNLSELEDSMDLITQQPDSTENHDKESSFLPTLVSETLSDNDRPTENLLQLNETTTEVPIIDNIEQNKADEYPQSCSFEDIERKSAEKMEVDEVNEFEKMEVDEVNEFEKIDNTVALNLSESIQEFTGLEKQLEPENVTPEESPIAKLTPSIEDKIMNENVIEHKESVVQEVVEEKVIENKEPVVQEVEEKVIEHKEPVVQEVVEENLLLDTKEEEALEAKEDVEIVQVTEITESVGTTESTALSKSTELAASIGDIVIEKASDAFELVTPIETAEISSTLKDNEKTVISTGVKESEETAKNVEMTKSVDAAAMEMIETAEIANIAKTADISEALPVTMQDVEEQKEPEPSKVVKSLKREDEKVAETDVLAAGGIAAVVAGSAVAAATATSTSNKAKGGKPMTKSMKPGNISAKTAPLKSTPTSPSKTATLTTKSASSTTATTMTTTKKPAGSTAARPKHLDTAPAKSTTSTNAAKSTTTTKMASKTSATVTSTTKTAATRSSNTQMKSKPLPASARSTASSVEKKSSALNGDAKPPSKTTVKAATKSTSALTSAKTTSTSKTTTGSRTSTSAITSTTMTSSSAASKSRPTSATTGAKSPAKSASTNTTSGGGLLNTAKSKVTSSSNNTPKTTRTSIAKSPMIDKQIKETANKQISMSRTTSFPTTKTTRSSGSATTTLNSNTTKRLSSQKSTSTTSTSVHSPIKKVASKVSSGHSSGTTKSSSMTKVKVMQNGTTDNAEITKTMTTTTTTTATTIITADIKNEDDVPKKDLSPVVAHTDNQLISSAD